MTLDPATLELKKGILRAACRAGEGHIPSAFSILDIVWALYDKVMTKDDIFILSKGHGCLALYAVLAAKKVIRKKDLMSFCQPGSILGGHPDRNKVPGVEASTGSLGHGLPIAVGRALAKKIKKEPGRVFCLIGDGEANEGSVWESLMLATHHELINLTVIVDYNGSTKQALDISPLDDKFKAFGFYTLGCSGHDDIDLSTSLKLSSKFRPMAVIASTTKGNGVPRFAEPEWHHRAPTQQELKQILIDLEFSYSLDAHLL